MTSRRRVVHVQACTCGCSIGGFHLVVQTLEVCMGLESRCTHGLTCERSGTTRASGAVHASRWPMSAASRCANWRQVPQVRRRALFALPLAVLRKRTPPRVQHLSSVGVLKVRSSAAGRMRRLEVPIDPVGWSAGYVG